MVSSVSGDITRTLLSKHKRNEYAVQLSLLTANKARSISYLSLCLFVKSLCILQFHLGFHPINENKEHIMECRKFLGVNYPMAVEFRSRVWFTTENLHTTLDWLKQHNIGEYSNF